jgi:hydrogenase maturation protease
VVDGGPAPENCVGALRAFAPHLVVVVDAARMGQPPGTLLRIDPSDPRLAGASTHTMPLSAFCEYVEATLGCAVTLLGIEPADTSFGEGLTPAVERAVEEIVRDALAGIADRTDDVTPPKETFSRFDGRTFETPSENRHSRESGNPGREEPGPPLPLRDPLRDAQRDAKRDPRGRKDCEGAPSPWAARQRFSSPSSACPGVEGRGQTEHCLLQETPRKSRGPRQLVDGPEKERSR